MIGVSSHDLEGISKPLYAKRVGLCVSSLFGADVKDRQGPELSVQSVLLCPSVGFVGVRLGTFVSL